MLNPNHSVRSLIGGMLLLTASAWSLRGEEVPSGQEINPIARVARLFNPQLVEVEERLTMLSRELSAYARVSKHALDVGLGYRGCRSAPGAADPSITLDLGTEVPIESIFLVPSQREFLEDLEIFPKRFTLEVSRQADFGASAVVFASSGIGQRPPDGIPVACKLNETARYVRLTVQEGLNKGTLDLFGLAEFVVISKGEPVSFGATVSTVGALNTPGIWYPEALTDGRTPLGIWQLGSQPKLDPGDAVEVASPDQSTTWTVRLDTAATLDRIVLFPYQSNLSCEESVFPEALTIRLGGDDKQPGEVVWDWTNPVPGASHLTPLVIALHGKSATTVQVTATRPHVMGERKIHALSEIEIWSHGTNLAHERPVTRVHAGQSAALSNLTDGYSSVSKILPVAVWLHQLHERDRIERELTPLRAAQRQLASNSELNATWGSAMILGLTFLIPVFIIERRRLMTKDQLDQMRKRISADLHDDVGSNLGSISLIARTACKDLIRLNGPPEIAVDLTEVETIARESSLAMRDIVWLLERKQDSIGDLVQRMRETAGRLLREIQFTLECESNKSATKLSLDAKRHLFLFYKESIHNILKHSQATRVSIRLWDERDKLALEILDNGIGIPMDAAERPAAVNKLEERARLLNGVLQITSSKETGTRIRLLITRSHLTTRTALA
jgi:signal transduction histidine kinase